MFIPAGVSLDLSQPAAALQSQKVQPSAMSLQQQNNSLQAAAAPHKQVQTKIRLCKSSLQTGHLWMESNVSGFTAGGASRDANSTHSRVTADQG